MSSCRIPKMYQPSHSKKKMPTLYFVLKFLDEEFIIQSTVVLFQSSCRIKILYQIAEKAADKCEDFAKYIYIKNSTRKLRFLTFFPLLGNIPSCILTHQHIENEGLEIPHVKNRGALMWFFFKLLIILIILMQRKMNHVGYLC